MVSWRPAHQPDRRYPGLFRKRKALNCNCRKHRRGNPHIPFGTCGRECGPAFVERRRWRKAVLALKQTVESIDCEA